MRQYPFKIEAIVILPDHLHLIMSLPQEKGDYSLRWNFIKGSFSKQIIHNKGISNYQKNRRERGIWQNRFWEHLIRDEMDFENHVNYIHFNPVKHGYIKRARDWQYSSIHKFIKNGIIEQDWGYDSDFSLLNWGE